MKNASDMIKDWPDGSGFVDGTVLDSLQPLVVPDEWTLIKPPTPQDEEIYDIYLNSKEVIEGVEFWAFGGGFKPLSRRVKGKLVAYPLEDVHSFKRHNKVLST